MKPTLHKLENAFGVLNYQKYGCGREFLICFHGFGQHGEVFRPIVELMGGDFTIISVDLYHFGLSKRTSSAPLTTQEWSLTFGRLCAAEGVSTFHICGYSLGGKFALASMMAFPSNCLSIHLMAPDGIRSSFWYEFSTFPLVSKILFKPLTDHASAIPRVIYYLEKMGVVNNKMALFGRNMTETQQQREQLYKVWMLCRPLKYKRRSIIDTLNRCEIPTYLYLGKYDLIIKPHIFDQFIKKIGSAHKVIIECGHNHLIQKSSTQVCHHLTH